MAHLVSAFVSQGGNRLVFAQLAVADGENEVAAVPRLLALLALLALLDLRGAVVTIDAIGCQRAVCRQVVEAGGDYVLPVKDNQPAPHAKVRSLMNDLALDHATAGAAPAPARGPRVGYFEHHEAGHGRVETRRVWVTDEVRWLGEELLALWPGLATGSVALVERTRQDPGDVSGRVSVERRVYISSLGGTDAAATAGYVRGHWAVENNLHWQLDVAFGEDHRRTRKGHGAENYSRLCRIALNPLKQDTTVKAGIKAKRLNAGWDHDYLLRLISQ